MKFSQLAKSIWTLTGTDSYTLELDEIVTLCNIELDTFGMLGSLPGLNETYFGKEFTRNLDVGVRKYTLPDDLIHIHNVSVKIAGEWEDATQYLGTDIEDETKIIEIMNGSKPRYKIFGNTIKIYSREAITAVESGIKIQGTMFPTQFTEDDFNVNDREMNVARDDESQGLVRQFHKLLLYRVVIMWKTSQDKPVSLNQTEQSYQGQLSDVIESLGLYVNNRRYSMSEPRDAYYHEEGTNNPLSD